MKPTFREWLEDQLLAEGPDDWNPSDDEMDRRINSLSNVELVRYLDEYLV